MWSLQGNMIELFKLVMKKRITEQTLETSRALNANGTFVFIDIWESFEEVLVNTVSLNRTYKIPQRWWKIQAFEPTSGSEGRATIYPHQFLYIA